MVVTSVVNSSSPSVKGIVSSVCVRVTTVSVTRVASVTVVSSPPPGTLTTVFVHKFVCAMTVVGRIVSTEYSSSTTVASVSVHVSKMSVVVHRTRVTSVSSNFWISRAFTNVTSYSYSSSCVPTHLLRVIVELVVSVQRVCVSVSVRDTISVTVSLGIGRLVIVLSCTSVHPAPHVQSSPHGGV